MTIFSRDPLPDRVKPVSPLARALCLVWLREDACSSTTSCQCPASSAPSRVTHLFFCSLSLALFHSFQRCSSLRLASRHDSLPTSSGFLEPRCSLSRHELFGCCVAGSAATALVLVLVLVTAAEEDFVRESESVEVVVIDFASAMAAMRWCACRVVGWCRCWEFSARAGGVEVNAQCAC
ncbi:hypothetical protein FB567DRAFT_533755 [Paraphoma chrysanthemicola]|uniref:Uncharacterized protein n=1 Tax=Paraphoma chrysanthemicola TaxID=798071 RepID=A0A8K0R0Q7_9PLEO|nr:hypothetical protein FB567DRAFT_533755 [Paraphoma chrysanthemicola]